MAEYPLGKGERGHPKLGNALLITRNANGDKVKSYLWIAQFSTNLNLQIDTAQVKSGRIYRPIRMAERFLVFSTLWNVKDRPKYLELRNKIRGHWEASLDALRPEPMQLIYYGGNKTWRGFIENIDIGYKVTDVILTYQFRMRLLTSQTDNKFYAKMTNGKSPMAPTSSTVKDFGVDWYSADELVAMAEGLTFQYNIDGQVVWRNEQGEFVANDPDKKPPKHRGTVKGG